MFGCQVEENKIEDLKVVLPCIIVPRGEHNGTERTETARTGMVKEAIQRFVLFQRLQASKKPKREHHRNTHTHTHTFEHMHCGGWEWDSNGRLFLITNFFFFVLSQRLCSFPLTPLPPFDYYLALRNLDIRQDGQSSRLPTQLHTKSSSGIVFMTHYIPRTQRSGSFSF